MCEVRRILGFLGRAYPYDADGRDYSLTPVRLVNLSLNQLGERHHG